MYEIKDCSTLYFAAKKGNLDIVKYLIEKCKVDPNIQNDKENTPLHLASEKGDLNFVK